jgi:hypothetical protein
MSDYGRFIVQINGFEYRNASDHFGPGQAVSCEITHRDNEAAQLVLTVFDRVDPASAIPYVEFNRHPNPRIVPDISVQGWGGLADGPLVKMFDGVLVIKSMDEEIPSMTKFVAFDHTYKLRRRGKDDTFKGLTVKAMLIKKGAEHGITVQFDRSAANEPALNEPMVIFYQISEVNWDIMIRHIQQLGFVTYTRNGNILVVTRDKKSARSFDLVYGDDRIKRLSVRQENKRDKRSPRQRGHHHETTAGKHAHYPKETLVPNDSGRGVHWKEAPLPKDLKREHQHTLAKPAVLGKGKRRQVEGDELDCEFRLEPSMINHQLIQVSKFGPQIDGIYESRMVRHIMGPQWTTTVEGWRE